MAKSNKVKSAPIILSDLSADFNLFHVTYFLFYIYIRIYRYREYNNSSIHFKNNNMYS